jgi:hypothetical protein
LYDTGSAVLLGTQTAGSGKFMVYSATPDNHYQAVGSAPSLRFADTITSPTYTAIIGMATATNHFIIGAVAGDMVLSNNTNSAGNFLFGTGATERMRINASTGNVSINNTNNTFKFDVTGTARFTGQLTLGSTITNGTYTYTLPSATGTLALTSDIPSLSGYVPTSRTLTINGVAYDLSADRSWTVTGGVGGSGTTNYLPKFTGTSTIGNSSIVDTPSTAIVIQKNGSSITAPLVTILPTTSTNAMLMQLDNAGAGTFYIGRQNSSGNSDLLGSIGAYASVVGHTGSQTLHLVTNALSRVQIDGSGNLGLGVTPSAWQSGTKALQINGGSMYAANTYTFVGSNIVYTDAGDKYINTGFATVYGQLSGEHRWYNAPSGTAGNAISFTQAMTLNASGNLSIGNTNDTYKLDVTGTGRFTGQVTIKSGNGNQLLLDNAGERFTQMYFFNNNTYKSAIWWDNNTSKFEFYTGVTALSIASTGAATFSSSVTATQFNVGTGTFNLSSGDALLDYSLASVRLRTYKTGVGYITPLLIDSQTGAATFSSSVTAQTDIISKNNSANVSYLSFQRYSNTQQYTYLVGNAESSGYLAMHTNDTERMRITSGGNVGIGLTNPSYKLHVVGSTDVINATSTSTDARINIGHSGNGGYIGYANIGAGNAANTFYVTTGSGVIGSGITMNSAGNVGIGTTSPGYKLHVYTSDNEGIYLQGTGGGIWMNVKSGTGKMWSYGAQSDGCGIYNRTDGVYRMFITDSGATTFSGSVTAGGNIITSGNNNNIYSYNTDANGQPGLVVANNSTLGTSTNISYFKTYNNAATTLFGQSVLNWLFVGTEGAANNGILFGTVNSRPVIFGTDNTERMRISSAGNVAIGSTNANDLRLRVVGDHPSGLAVLGVQAASGSVSSIGLFDSGGTRKLLIYRDTGFVGIETASDPLLLNTNGTERMRITSGGNLLVGTTSDNNSKVQVQGQVRTTGGYIFDNQASSGNFTWYGYGGNIYAYSSSVGNLATINGSTGAYTATSDINKKKDFELSTLGLDAVMGLKPTLYRMKSEYGTEKHLGFIAQEVKDYIPQAYVKNGEFIGLNEMPLIAALTRAVQELKAELDSIKNK